MLATHNAACSALSHALSLAMVPNTRCLILDDDGYPIGGFDDLCCVEVRPAVHGFSLVLDDKTIGAFVIVGPAGKSFLAL